jgi:hypothetical protein
MRTRELDLKRECQMQDAYTPRVNGTMIRRIIADYNVKYHYSANVIL